MAIASPSVGRLCRAIATIVRSYYYQYYFAELLPQLLCGATYTFTTILHSFYYYYCAKLLPPLLYRTYTTTIVQSFYYRRARGHGVPNYFSLTKDCHDRSKATEDNEQLNNVTGNNVYGEKNITNKQTSITNLLLKPFHEKPPVWCKEEFLYRDI